MQANSNCIIHSLNEHIPVTEMYLLYVLQLSHVTCHMQHMIQQGWWDEDVMVGVVNVHVRHASLTLMTTSQMLSDTE